MYITSIAAQIVFYFILILIIQELISNCYHCPAQGVPGPEPCPALGQRTQRRGYHARTDQLYPGLPTQDLPRRRPN